MKIITRSDALRAGSKTFFTGKACKYGHVAYRYAVSGSCSDCVKAANGHPATGHVVPDNKRELQIVEAAENRRKLAEQAAEKRTLHARARNMLMRTGCIVQDAAIQRFRDYVVFQVLMVSPLLTYDDVIRKGHYAGPGHWKFWIPPEINTIIQEEARRLRLESERPD